MNKKLKKSVSAALICAMLLTTAATALNVTAYADTTTTVSTTSSKTDKVTSKNVNWYIESKESKIKSPIYFANGTDVPYLEISDFIGVMAQYYVANGNPDCKFDVATDGDTVTLTRENGHFCSIDFTKNSIFFSDYNAFIKLKTDQTLVDGHNLILKDENGKDLYLKTNLKASNERYGKYITLDLDAYDIDLVNDDNGYYLPIQTLNDIFLKNVMRSMLYNGKSVFITAADGSSLRANGELTPLGKLYYKNKPKKFSKALTLYNYNELCFALDHFYGLKERHNISSFNDLFLETGLAFDLLSRDPEKMDTAVFKLISNYLDDQHSSYAMPSYASDSELTAKLRKKYGNGLSFDTSSDILNEFLAARAKFYPDGVPGYEEVGDTAFITFDKFSIAGLASGLDYYQTAPENNPNDTIGIMAYSVQQILRKGSPVKNVVLDLSCNGGGAIDTACYTVAALLGKADISLEDTLTGALVTTRYYADTNFEKKFNSKDHLAGKGLNIYCLTSDASFSCGNLVPSVLKQSSNASLIGQTSGGGACAVLSLCTATGTLFRTSSSNRISFLKNGSFYDVDDGAAVDYALSKKESFYDRKKLVEFIDSLL